MPERPVRVLAVVVVLVLAAGCVGSADNRQAMVSTQNDPVPATTKDQRAGGGDDAAEVYAAALADVSSVLGAELAAQLDAGERAARPLFASADQARWEALDEGAELLNANYLATLDDCQTDVSAFSECQSQALQVYDEMMDALVQLGVGLDGVGWQPPTRY